MLVIGITKSIMIEIASANTNSQTSNAKKYAYITTNSKSCTTLITPLAKNAEITSTSVVSIFVYWPRLNLDKLNIELSFVLSIPREL